jgi:hypothetical protein
MTYKIWKPVRIYHAFDRSRSMFDLPDIETITPIGEVCEPLSIDELCYNSAKYIIDRAGSQYIYVTWSGGIDSTLALTEILKQAPHDQIVVALNDNSIHEYPEFYEKYIKDKLRTTGFDYYTDNHLKKFIKDGVVVTGHLVDPVFGDSIYKVMSPERLTQKIESFLAECDNISISQYKMLIKGCPRKLENVKDLFWWIDYALNYQAEQLMWLLETEDMILDKNLFHFGAGKGWNDYAVSTPSEIKYKGTDYKNFKMPLKEQLFKFTKDSDYLENKLKYPSWRNYRTYNQMMLNKPIYITTDWKRGYLKK